MCSTPTSASCDGLVGVAAETGSSSHHATWRLLQTTISSYQTTATIVLRYKFVLATVLDQKLSPCRYSSCSCSCWGRRLHKSLRLCRFKSDRDELLQDCSSSEYASIDGVGFWMMSHFQDRDRDVISRKSLRFRRFKTDRDEI